MKNKGFTLIELLAVIVILAIIALIATPIILGIINDAREQSNERSVELYTKALELAIARKNLDGSFNPSSCEVTNGIAVCDGVILDVDVQNASNINGIIELDTNWKIISNTLTIGVSTEPIDPLDSKTYYSWSSGTVGGQLPSDATKNLSQLDTHGNSFYLKLISENNETVSEASICFEIDEETYCLKWNSLVMFDENKEILDRVFTDCRLDQVTSNGIIAIPTLYTCTYSDFFVSIDDSGMIKVNVPSSAWCNISSGIDTGYYYCNKSY